MGYERLSPQQIAQQAAQIQTSEDLGRYIDNARAALQASEVDSDGFAKRVGEVSAILSQADQDLDTVGAEIAQMWADTPPRE